MKVEVRTYHPDKHPAIHETAKAIDWTDSSDRKWLMNHLHWAMNNQRDVTLSPESN